MMIYILYIDNENSYLKSCSLNFNYYIDNKKLNETVEILSEENNEWEDIEEYDLKPDDWSFPTQADMEIQKRLNIVIKNQKYLKERIDKNEQRNN